MRLLHLTLFTAFPAFLNAQDIKSLDKCKHYAHQKVQTRKCVEIKFDGYTPTDTLDISYEEFDSNGRIIRYIEYSPIGKQLAEYHYSYNAKNQIAEMTVSHQYTDWQEIILTPTYDASNKMLSRQPKEKIHGLWEKETFQYDVRGELVCSEQWYTINGELKPVTKKFFPMHIEKKENSLSYIFDNHDLLIIEQLYQSGKSDKTRSYFYTFY
jgi:uncharacterized protein YkuJ